MFYDLPYAVGCSVSCYLIFPVGSFREINLIFFPLVNFSRFSGIYFCFLATKEKIIDAKIKLDSNNVNDFRDLEFPSYKTELKNEKGIVTSQTELLTQNPLRKTICKMWIQSWLKRENRELYIQEIIIKIWM